MQEEFEQVIQEQLQWAQMVESSCNLLKERKKCDKNHCEHLEKLVNSFKKLINNDYFIFNFVNNEVY